MSKPFKVFLGVFAFFFLVTFIGIVSKKQPKSFDDEWEPAISESDPLLQKEDSKASPRFFESERKRIWTELKEAEEQALTDAKNRTYTSVKDEKKLAKKLKEDYRAKVLIKYGIALNEISKINREGKSKGWPISKQNRSSANLSRVPKSSNIKKSLEYQLAVINAGGYVPEDHITIARFRTLLGLLSDKFVESKQQLSDMSVKTQKMLTDVGVSEQLLNIMEGMNSLFYSKPENLKYPEYAAAYYMMRKKGSSHHEAIESVRALLNSLGIY